MTHFSAAHIGALLAPPGLSARLEAAAHIGALLAPPGVSARLEAAAHAYSGRE